MKPMSEVFELPVVVDSTTGQVGEGCLELGDNDYWFASFGVHGECTNSQSHNQAQHAAHAINSHDLLVEALRKALLWTDEENDVGCLTALLYSIKTLKYNDMPPQWFMSTCQYSALATVATGVWFIVKNVWGF